MQTDTLDIVSGLTLLIAAICAVLGFGCARVGFPEQRELGTTDADAADLDGGAGGDTRVDDSLPDGPQFEGDGQGDDADPGADSSTDGPFDLAMDSDAVLDSDGDEVVDLEDNCILVANADQRDTNGDGFGNVCDPDLNDDLMTDDVDAAILKAVFLTDDPDADLNADGVVNGLDVGIMKSLFGLPPGPSGLNPP